MKHSLKIVQLIILGVILSCSSSNASYSRLSKDENYSRALNWMRDINKYGWNSQVVDGFKKDLDRAIGKNRAVCVIGWGLTKAGKAYKVEWAEKDLVITPLSKDKAKQLECGEFETKCTIK